MGGVDVRRQQSARPARPATRRRGRAARDSAESRSRRASRRRRPRAPAETSAMPAQARGARRRVPGRPTSAAAPGTGTAASVARHVTTSAAPGYPVRGTASSHAATRRDHRGQPRQAAHRGELTAERCRATASSHGSPGGYVGTVAVPEASGRRPRPLCTHGSATPGMASGSGTCNCPSRHRAACAR